jgi:hypothetical protein
VIRIGWPRWPRSAAAAPAALVLGLSAEDLTALTGGQEKRFMATVPGLKLFQVVITYGLTDDTLAARLVYERLMPITGVRRDPEAANA